jgi:hypothetical protein
MKTKRGLFCLILKICVFCLALYYEDRRNSAVKAMDFCRSSFRKKALPKNVSQAKAVLILCKSVSKYFSVLSVAKKQCNPLSDKNLASLCLRGRFIFGLKMNTFFQKIRKNSKIFEKFQKNCEKLIRIENLMHKYK